MFCNHDKQMEQAYEDLLNSSKQTLASMMELQEVQLAAYIIFFPFNPMVFAQYD